MTLEQQFQLFMAAVSDYALFFTDPEGRIKKWSASAEKIIGYSETEAVQMNGRVIFTAEDRGRGAPELEMQTAVRNGQANDERWHVRKDGSLFFAVGRLVALKDESGHLVGFAKIVRDATPHKTLDQALHAGDEHFRATFGQAPIGIVLTDLRGRIEQANAAFCQLTGFADRELEGRQLLSLTAEDDRVMMQRNIDEMLAGKRAHILVDKRMVRVDGSTVWVQNSAAILRDAESRPMSFIDLVQDISALKRSELALGQAVDERTSALDEKTKQMEAFCYTVAHDLRAPLRAIAGYAEFLRQDFAGNLPSSGVDFVERIKASASRLDRLISDLLGYTRMQQVPVVREQVDLTAVVTRVIDQLKSDTGNPALDIVVEGDLGTVRADAATLEHVFINLLSNAVKFTREGIPPNVRIRAEDQGTHIRVWVEDNGTGIDPRFTHKIFGMFERLHTDRKIPGTGMGLAIVSTAMERLGGRRGVEPNHPAGSRFWIEVPK